MIVSQSFLLKVLHGAHKTILEEVMTVASVLWLQVGGCSGNIMFFLHAEEPSACDLVTDFWYRRCPYGLSATGRTMILADSGNNRVLLWDRRS